MVTARELNQQFEWTAHEPAALAAGVEQAVIDAVKFRRPVTALAAPDALVIELGREAFRNRSVGLATFNEALNVFGAKNLAAGTVNAQRHDAQPRLRPAARGGIMIALRLNCGQRWTA